MTEGSSSYWSRFMQQRHNRRSMIRGAVLAGGGLAGHKALIAQRIARYIGTQMMFHAIVYRRFDPQLWTRLHQQYLDADHGGYGAERVKDSLEGDGGLTSFAETYVQIVLLQAAFLSEMTAPQMDFAEALYISELRSGQAGHFSYRRVAWEMYRALEHQHPTLAQHIRVTDFTQPIDMLNR